MYILHFINPLSIDGHLCYQFWAIINNVNNAAVNICAQVFVWALFLFLLGIYT